MIDNQYLKRILKSVSDSTANKVCKRIEILSDAAVLSEKDAFILKSDLKNIIHESFREVKNHAVCWQHGSKYKNLKVYNPKNNA